VLGCGDDGIDSGVDISGGTDTGSGADTIGSDDADPLLEGVEAATKTATLTSNPPRTETGLCIPLPHVVCPPLAEGQIDPLDDLRPERALGVERIDSEEVMDHLVMLREVAGLSTDREFIRSLYEQPDETRPWRALNGFISHGLRFSSEETDDVIAFGHASWISMHVGVYMRETYPTQYTATDGVGKVVEVLCAHCDPVAIEQDLRRNIWGSERKAVLTVRRVDRSGVDLDALRNEVERIATDHGIVEAAIVETDGGTRFGLSIATDRFANNIMITAISGLDTSVLEEQFGDLVTVVRDDTMIAAGPQLRKDEPLGYNLVTGGQAVVRQGSDYVCTSGFAVQSGYGPFMLTAGHCASNGICGSLGEDWVQGGLKLGVMSVCNYQSSYDAAAITTYGSRNNIGRIHWTSDDNLHPVTFAVNATMDTEIKKTQTVCQTGRSTTGMSGNQALPDLGDATRCGFVLNVKSTVPWPGQNGQPFSSTFYKTNYMALGGDSGAGVVWMTGYGFGAVGIHTGGVQGPGIHYATKFSEIAKAWGITLTPVNI